MTAEFAVPRRIRVLQLGGPMGLYGAERWILALIGQLPTASIESIVGVIKDAPGPAPELCEEARRRGFRTVLFDGPGKLSAAAIAQLRAFIRSERIDVLHTHFYKSDLIGRLAVRGTSCKIVATPHGWSVNAGAKLQIYEALDRLAFYTFDAVCPLSLDLHAGLARLPGMARRLHLIQNAVDIAEVDSARAAPPEGGAAGMMTIGYIGQLIPRKGLDVLLRALRALDRPTVRLWLIGDGPQRAELAELAGRLGISAQIGFLGYRNDRLSLLKACDIFVLPSRLEGIPRCILEAMSAGVPVVGSDIPGTRSLIRDGVTGLMFPVDDEAALTAALGRLLDDPNRCRAIAAAANQYVRAEFSAARMAGRYAELFADLVGRGGSSDRPAP